MGSHGTLYLGQTWIPKWFLGLGIQLPLVAPAFRGGYHLWVLGMAMGFPCLLCRASSAASGIQPAHKAKLLEVFIAFPPGFFFFIISILDMFFDSFYLLSHHLSSCTGATPDVLNPLSRLEQPSFKNKSCQRSGLFSPLYFLHTTNCFSHCVFALLHEGGVL